MSQRWLVVDSSVSDLIGLRFEPQPPVPGMNALPLDQQTENDQYGIVFNLFFRVNLGINDDGTITPPVVSIIYSSVSTTSPTPVSLCLYSALTFS